MRRAQSAGYRLACSISCIWRKRRSLAPDVKAFCRNCELLCSFRLRLVSVAWNREREGVTTTACARCRSTEVSYSGVYRWFVNISPRCQPAGNLPPFQTHPQSILSFSEVERSSGCYKSPLTTEARHENSRSGFSS